MTDILRRLVDRLTHDRKITVLVVLLAFSLLLWGRLLLQSDLPRTATADPAASAQAPAPASAPVVERTAPEGLPRDLSNPQSDQNGRDRSKNANPEQTEEKSTSKRPDDSLRLATVRQAAENLQPQNVAMDDAPSAIINSRVLTLGQQIQGFTLLKGFQAARAAGER